MRKVTSVWVSGAASLALWAGVGLAASRSEGDIPFRGDVDHNAALRGTETPLDLENLAQSPFGQRSDLIGLLGHLSDIAMDAHPGDADCVVARISPLLCPPCHDGGPPPIIRFLRPVEDSTSLKGPEGCPPCFWLIQLVYAAVQAEQHNDEELLTALAVEWGEARSQISHAQVEAVVAGLEACAADAECWALLSGE